MKHVMKINKQQMKS